jgi:uncharacterized protein
MDTNERVDLIPNEAPYGGTLDAGPWSTIEAIGSLVAISGSEATMQFAAAATGVTVGSLVGIDTGQSLAIGSLSEVARNEVRAGEHDTATGRIDLLGEIATDARGEHVFQAGITAYPKLDAAVVAIGTDELRVIFDLGNPNTVAIGRLCQNDAIAAYVNIDEIVQKHFAIVGSTGSGKSTALALMLRKIMEARADLRMLVIDAHNEYGECFDDRAFVAGPGNLKLPFWLFNFDELVELMFGANVQAEREIGLLADLIPLAKGEYARSKTAVRSSYRPAQGDVSRYTADTPVPYRMDDLIAFAESRMGKLENGDVSVSYQRLIMRLNAVRRNPRYGFIFDDAGSTADTMVEVLRQLLRVRDDERPMAIVQLASFPAETMEIIVSVLFRLAFEFGVWSDGFSPLLIVCEEAHNYANADQTLGFRAARDGLSRIAKEGRKHGVFLGLVTQRPHLLDPTLISQCSTMFAMRLGHDDDQKIVRAAVSDSASRQLAFLPSLGTREALVIGAGVPTLMRLRFEELPWEHIPRSQAEWSGRLDDDRTDEQVIATVVARWRGTAPVVRPAPEPVAPEPEMRFTDGPNWSAPYRR